MHKSMINTRTSLVESEEEVKKRRLLAEKRVRERKMKIDNEFKEKVHKTAEERSRLLKELKEVEKKEFMKEQELIKANLERMKLAQEREKEKPREHRSQKNIAFGSSTPRELSYLNNLSKEEKIYDRRLTPKSVPSKSDTHSKFDKSLMTGSLYQSSRSATPQRPVPRKSTNLMTQSCYVPRSTPVRPPVDKPRLPRQSRPSATPQKPPTPARKPQSAASTPTGPKARIPLEKPIKAAAKKVEPEAEKLVEKVQEKVEKEMKKELEEVIEKEHVQEEATEETNVVAKEPEVVREEQKEEVPEAATEELPQEKVEELPQEKTEIPEETPVVPVEETLVTPEVRVAEEPSLSVQTSDEVPPVLVSTQEPVEQPVAPTVEEAAPVLVSQSEEAAPVHMTEEAPPVELIAIGDEAPTPAPLANSLFDELQQNDEVDVILQSPQTPLSASNLMFDVASNGIQAENGHPIQIGASHQNHTSITSSIVEDLSVEVPKKDMEQQIIDTNFTEVTKVESVNEEEKKMNEEKPELVPMTDTHGSLPPSPPTLQKNEKKDDLDVKKRLDAILSRTRKVAAVDSDIPRVTSLPNTVPTTQLSQNTTALLQKLKNRGETSARLTSIIQRHGSNPLLDENPDDPSPTNL